MRNLIYWQLKFEISAKKKTPFLGIAYFWHVLVPICLQSFWYLLRPKKPIFNAQKHKKTNLNFLPIFKGRNDFPTQKQLKNPFKHPKNGPKLHKRGKHIYWKALKEKNPKNLDPREIVFFYCECYHMSHLNQKNGRLRRILYNEINVK